ncbi:MAG TPA: hypothetical protein VFS13_06130 [Steroidobacteraceae bacterium]|nr:hypothetical protein [Steroidobacteraceae bacterium]
MIMQGDIDPSPLQALASLESFGPADGTPFTTPAKQLDALRARASRSPKRPDQSSPLSAKNGVLNIFRRTWTSLKCGVARPGALFSRTDVRENSTFFLRGRSDSSPGAP